MYQHSIQPQSVPLRREEVAELVAMARSVIGITIDERKTDFLSGRLARRLAANGLSNYGEYCRLLRETPSERVAFGEALTTHTTSFFREKVQYDWLLQEGLVNLCASSRSPRDLVVWSAACSSGQEGYSALMTLNQARDRHLTGIAPRLTGTDVSSRVIMQTKAAIYSRQEIEGIPEELRRRFLLSSKSSAKSYRIAPELRAQATWRQANLVTGDGLDGITADIIFLRNVLIYFDEEIRGRVLFNVVRRLRPGGFLLTGHTEASTARCDELELVCPSIYRKL